MEINQEKQRKIHMAFIDVRRKALYDRVPCQDFGEVWERGSTREVQNDYTGMRTQVKSSTGLTDKIPMGIGLHQGTSPSPYLFAEDHPHT